MTPAQLGRAATVETAVCRSPMAPWQGEVGQKSFGLNAQLARFIRQLRRVQAFN